MSWWERFAVGVIVVVVCIALLGYCAKSRDCEAANGVLVRGAFSYHCVDKAAVKQ